MSVVCFSFQTRGRHMNRTFLLGVKHRWCPIPAWLPGSVSWYLCYCYWRPLLYNIQLLLLTFSLFLWKQRKPSNSVCVCVRRQNECNHVWHWFSRKLFLPVSDSLWLWPHCGALENGEFYTQTQNVQKGSRTSREAERARGEPGPYTAPSCSFIHVSLL